MPFTRFDTSWPLTILIAVFTMGVGTYTRAQDRTLERAPNILFILADDQRTDTIAAHGNPNIQTPNIDKLVERGFSFRRNYCMGSIHGAVCVPSRAMIMSGRSLYHVPNDLSGVETLPALLHRQGYTTFGTGKWHNGRDSFSKSFEQGKAVFLGGMANHTAVPVSDLAAGKFVNERVGKKFSSELFADAAIDFLEQYEKPEPFFLYVSFTAPHDPRQPPERFREQYYASRPPLPANFMPQHPFNNGWMIGRDENLAPWPRPESMLQDQLAEYYGMITHMDEQIGRILTSLEASRHASNTIVVYAADHGLALGSHGLLGKQNLYEHSTGAPLIFAGPGIPKGSSHALSYLYDIFPTLTELAGIDAPASVEGKSLRAIWSGERETVRETLYTTYENSQRALTDGRWKLIRYPLIDYNQLFDLQSDPHELNSLASRPEQAKRLEDMLALLKVWHARLDDPHPLKVESTVPMEIDLTGTNREPDRWQPDWVVRKYFESAGQRN